MLGAESWEEATPGGVIATLALCYLLKERWINGQALHALFLGLCLCNGSELSPSSASNALVIKRPKGDKHICLQHETQFRLVNLPEQRLDIWTPVLVTQARNGLWAAQSQFHFPGEQYLCQARRCVRAVQSESKGGLAEIDASDLSARNHLDDLTEKLQGPHRSQVEFLDDDEASWLVLHLELDVSHQLPAVMRSHERRHDAVERHAPEHGLGKLVERVRLAGASAAHHAEEQGLFRSAATVVGLDSAFQLRQHSEDHVVLAAYLDVKEIGELLQSFE